MVAIGFRDDIINATTLRKSQKQWLERAYNSNSGITITYGDKRLALVNREQIGQLQAYKYYTELLLRYCQESEKGTKSDTFPWAENLSEQERLEFRVELLSCVMKSIITNDWSTFEELLGDWRATAEAATDPDMIGLLQRQGRASEEYITLT